MSGTAIVWIVILAACGLFVTARTMKRSIKAAKETRQAELTEISRRQTAEFEARMQQATTAREAYFNSLGAHWLIRTPCEESNQKVDLLISADAALLRVVPRRSSAAFEAAEVYDVELRNVVEARVERPTKYRTVTRTEDVYVPQANRKSTLGRTLAGGVLLGPIGAMAGAASSMKGPPPKKETRTIDEQVPYEGAPFLYVTTRDLHRPTLRFEFYSVQVAEEWRSRIVAAMG